VPDCDATSNFRQIGELHTPNNPANVSTVTDSPRRIYLYWLLLLVPTLAVGVVAVKLLLREQTRLVTRSDQAEQARRAAVEARARLIAENVELLIGDVENGLLDTLAETPAAQLDPFLDQWEKSNPLVRAAFRCSTDGRLLRPAPTASDETARGFRRRFATLFQESPPWNPRPSSKGQLQSSAQDSASDFSAPAAQQMISSNSFQAQSARRDLQQLARERSAPSVADRKSEAETMMKDIKKQAPPVLPDRRGWSPWPVDGRMHLIGWVQPGGAGEVRGVELELAALIARLGGTLPAELPADEGYALHDDKGNVLQQAGLVPRDNTPTVQVPLAAGLLPGWEVVGYLPRAAYASSADGGFFLVGSLLLGIFVVAILSGGSLLLWQARQSAAEARQKTSFVANVSHEFKTPLTTIRLYSELLEQGRVPDDAKRTDYLRTIGRETQRLARLVNNVLDFSRLEQGRKKFQREPLELGAELARLLDTHDPRLVEAGLKLERVLPAAPLTVTTDRDAFEQIAINLLDNACKYAAAGGEVTVELTPRAAGGAELRILDRGPGVPSEHRERIFDKFHRVDDTLIAEKTGAGLGLSIARQLARGLGGELRYAPREGGGASFILELP
jgi:signal transduction histidine kinase